MTSLVLRTIITENKKMSELLGNCGKVWVFFPWYNHYRVLLYCIQWKPIVFSLLLILIFTPYPLPPQFLLLGLKLAKVTKILLTDGKASKVSILFMWKSFPEKSVIKSKRLEKIAFFWIYDVIMTS